MPSVMQCPHCGQSYPLNDEQVKQYTGRQVTCQKCQQVFDANPVQVASPLAPPPPPGPMMGQQVMYQPMSGPLESNGLATASLIVGILGFCVPVVGGIVALVLGIIALSKTNNGRVGGKGAAIAGIVLGAISIFASPCVAVLLPSLNRARETANRVKCASNLRQIGQGLLLYANDNKQAYPADLGTLAQQEQLAAATFICPSGSRAAPPAGLSGAALATWINANTDYVYIPGQDSSARSTSILIYEKPTDHSGAGMNLLYGDGHVEWQNMSMATSNIQAQTGHGP